MLKSGVADITISRSKDVDLIYFPTNVQGTHWFLTCVDVCQREIILYESLPEARADYMKKIQDLIAIWAERQEYTQLVPTLTVCAPKTKLNEDSSSCGLHTLANADCVGSGRDTNFYGTNYEKDMKFFRMRLRKLLLKFVVPDRILGSPGRVRIVRGQHGQEVNELDLDNVDDGDKAAEGLLQVRT